MTMLINILSSFFSLSLEAIGSRGLEIKSVGLLGFRLGSLLSHPGNSLKAMSSCLILNQSYPGNSLKAMSSCLILNQSYPGNSLKAISSCLILNQSYPGNSLKAMSSCLILNQSYPGNSLKAMSSRLFLNQSYSGVPRSKWPGHVSSEAVRLPAVARP